MGSWKTDLQTFGLVTERVRSINVQIVGFGVVGFAQAHLMQKLGHCVFIFDPFKGRVEMERNVDITFICTPEQNVEEALKTLIENDVRGLYVIKSTVPVGTTKSLTEQYKRHICHNPEFLRERHALEDVVNPSRIVIGECCHRHGEQLRDLYAPLHVKIFRTDPTTSEMIKLLTNAWRAVSISFWNEVAEVCARVGADVETVADACDTGKVLGEWEGGKWGTKFFGKPYGGRCLPKDVKHLIETFQRYGLKSKILEAAEDVNESLRGS